LSILSWTCLIFKNTFNATRQDAYVKLMSEVSQNAALHHFHLSCPHKSYVLYWFPYLTVHENHDALMEVEQEKKVSPAICSEDIASVVLYNTANLVLVWCKHIWYPHIFAMWQNYIYKFISKRLCITLQCDKTTCINL
jgi:hypothetical protein